MLKIKDNLFGQVRAPGTCYDIPENLQSIVTKQQVITWNNDYGMNPLWDKVPPGTIYTSYNDVFENSKLTCMTSGRIRNKGFKDRFGGDVFMSKVLGQWYQIQRLMDEPDILEYDYVIFRQTDTRYYAPARSRLFNYVFPRMERAVRSASGPACEAEAPKKNFKTHVPVMCSASSSLHPGASNHLTSGWSVIPQMRSSCWMMNRAGLEKIKDTFYEQIEREIEYYQQTIGFNCSHIHGQPAHLLAKVAIKNDIEIASLDEMESWIVMYEPIYTRDYKGLNRIRE